MYQRNITKKIDSWLFRGKIIILYGARQVGKTTLAKKFLEKYSDSYKTLYLNGEDPDVQENLIEKGAQWMKTFFGSANFIVLDEAQTIPNIGRIIKIFHDAFPAVQIFLTGSSSFDLSNSINEPLTGRSLEFYLFPLALSEIWADKNFLERQSIFQRSLLFGLYPEVVRSDLQDAKILLVDIAKKYLWKDILTFEGIKNSQLVHKILKALAYQLGNEVSMPELAKLVRSTQPTVERYIEILEKAFIVFSLPSFSTNQRKELRKSRKIYFYDTGIRNALIENFDDITLRNDRGALFENFFLLEKMKESSFAQTPSSFYFWRTYDQQEVDIIEKKEQKMVGFELKWNEKKQNITPPPSFQKNYPNAEFEVITPQKMMVL